MKHTIRLFALVLSLITVIAMCSLITAADELPVVYVADKEAGAGDGTSAANCFGTAEAVYTEWDSYNYGDATNSLHKKTALWKALDQNRKGAIIVFCGEFNFDVADLKSWNRGEWGSTNISDGSKYIFTSVYGGVDYRTKGAKVVFDKSEYHIDCNFKLDLTWENINIETKCSTETFEKIETESGYRAYMAPVLNCFGHTVTFGEGIKCTSNLGDDGLPIISGTSRTDGTCTQSNITIKSGSWGKVLMGGSGWSEGNPAGVNGNATLKVEGGKIGEIYCSGSPLTDFATVTGDITVDITGGEIGKVFGTQTEEVKSLKITVGENAKVGEISATGEFFVGSKPLANSSITFSTKAIAADKVTNFATATPVNAQEQKQEEQKPEQKQEEKKQEEQKPVPQTGSNVTLYVLISLACVVTATVVVRKKTFDR